jgi:hypothetical protein
VVRDAFSEVVEDLFEVGHGRLLGLLLKERCFDAAEWVEDFCVVLLYQIAFVCLQHEDL